MKTPPKAQLEVIAKRYHLRLIVLFGSQVSGYTHSESDVDVAVLAQGAPSDTRRLTLWRELSAAFGRDVDLTLMDRVDPVLQDRIARNSQLLYEDRKRAWENYRSYLLRRYWDSTKFREDVERYVTRRAQKARSDG